MKVRKPGHLTDEEKKALKEELRAGCRNVGSGSIYAAPGQRVGMFPKATFGLCGDCGHFSFIASQFRIKMAVCDQYDETFVIRLSQHDPVSECSNYYTKGEQDAHDYSKNAWLLDPPEGKMGFLT